MLYEMLTGEVPFTGSSPAEILMKHMTAVPELDSMEEPFGRVVRKALAKEPADRYQSAQEVVEDIFGSEHVRDSVSGFCPEELSIVAERVAKKAAAGSPGLAHAQGGAKQASEAAEDVGTQIAEAAKRFADTAEAIGKKVAGSVDAHADRLFGGKATGLMIIDSVDHRQRRMLGFATMLLVSLGAGMLSREDGIGFFGTVLSVFVMIAACSETILFWRRRLSGNLEAESQWVGKGAACCVASLLAALGALAVKFISIGEQSAEVEHLWFLDFRRMLGFQAETAFALPASVWLSLAGSMILVDWVRISSASRLKRLSLGSAVWAGLLGVIAALIFGAGGLIIGLVLAGTSLVVQAVSPFGKVVQQAEGVTQTQPQKDSRQRRGASSGQASAKSVRPFIRALWLLGFLAAASLGLSLLIWTVLDFHGDEFVLGIAFGVDILGVALFCLVMGGRRRFTSVYGYIAKPLLILVCVELGITSAILLVFFPSNDSEWVLSVSGALIASAVIAFVVARLTGRQPPGCSAVPRRAAAVVKAPARHAAGAAGSKRVSSFKRLWALLLSGGGMFGFCGLHRFYVGKIGTGILWFLTGGLFGIGQIIDVIMICLGQFKDRYGRPVTVWQEPSEANVAARAVGAKVEAVARAERREAGADKQAERTDFGEPEVQGTAASPVAPTTTILYEPFHPLSFLMSGVGTALTLAAVLLGLALGLRLPFLVAAGWPDAGLAVEMEQLFGYRHWPELVTHLGQIAVAVLLLLAIICLSAGRRHLGAAHLLRAVVGLIGILGAVLLFAGAAYGGSFNEAAEMLNSGQIGTAFELALGAFHRGKAIGAAVLFVLSVIILAWPARRKESAYVALSNQGVK